MRWISRLRDWILTTLFLITSASAQEMGGIFKRLLGPGGMMQRILEILSNKYSQLILILLGIGLPVAFFAKLGMKRVFSDMDDKFITMTAALIGLMTALGMLWGLRKTGGTEQAVNVLWSSFFSFMGVALMIIALVTGYIIVHYVEKGQEGSQ